MRWKHKHLCMCYHQNRDKKQAYIIQPLQDNFMLVQHCKTMLETMAFH